MTTNAKISNIQSPMKQTKSKKRSESVKEKKISLFTKTNYQIRTATGLLLVTQETRKEW